MLPWPSSRRIASPWSLSVVTEPATEPLDLADAKSHLRVDVADEDRLIASLIRAARSYVEMATGRALVTSTWDLSRAGFPYGGDAESRSLWLPKAPLQLVTSVSYRDATGASSTWSSANYTVSAPAGDYAQQGRVTANYGVAYPVTYDVPEAVTVRFVAGYGASSVVPDGLKHAMRLLIAHWYTAREPVAFDRRVEPVPLAVESLLWSFKAF